MNSDFTESQIRNALAGFATGVTVVTALNKHMKNIGMTVNSFNSVSLKPPLVLWSISCESRYFRDFMLAETFAIHVLAADQQDISKKFAGPEVDRFDGVSFSQGLFGMPLINHYRACFQCSVADRYPGGDHMIIVGKVIAIDNREHKPLICYGGGYGL